MGRGGRCFVGAINWTQVDVPDGRRSGHRSEDSNWKQGNELDEMTTYHYNDAAGTDRDYMLLSAFFLLLPFIYAAQVLSGHPAVGLVGYVPLLLLSLAVMRYSKQYLNFYKARPTFLGLLLLALVAHNAISGIGALLQGNVALGGRVLILFVLPFIVFVAGTRLSSERHWGIMRIVLFTAVAVAAELLWENVSNWVLVRSSWFQLLNRDYVLGQTGKDLTQLYVPAYRGTGLLEHVHVSTFYLAVGIVAGVTLYLKSGAKRYLIAAGFCEAVLVMHGVRLALVAGIAATVLSLTLNFWNSRCGKRNRLKNSALFLSLVFVLVLVTDPVGNTRRFYIPVVTNGVWNPDDADITPSAIIGRGIKGMCNTVLSRLGSSDADDFQDGLIGHGIVRSLSGDVVGLDDDFFVHQIFSQYGLLGGLVFFLIFLCSLLQGLRATVRSADERGLLLAFSVSVILLSAISTLHSGVMQRKVPFALLFWVLAIICSCSAGRSTATNAADGVARR